MARNPRWLRRAGVAAVACAAVPALTASPAGAAFTTAKCEGDPTAGAGASFQNLAHTLWRGNQVFRNSAHCGSSGPAVNYFSVGSGGGRTALATTTAGPNEGVRDVPAATKGSRFGAADAALSGGPTGQRALIERGRPAVTGDEGKIHALPTAVGAITIIVNFPDDCIVPSTSVAYHDPDAQPATDQDDTARFKVPSTRLEEAFAGGSTVNTWGELLDDTVGGVNIAANPATTNPPGGEKTDATCASAPIVRVVREDNSGTTDSFKRWLGRVPSRTSGAAWETTFFGSAGNQRWPNDPGTSGGNAFPDESATFKNEPQNEGVAGGVNANDGAIGYAELAQARPERLQQGDAPDRSAREELVRARRHVLAADPAGQRGVDHLCGADGRAAVVQAVERHAGRELHRRRVHRPQYDSQPRWRRGPAARRPDRPGDGDLRRLEPGARRAFVAGLRHLLVDVHPRVRRQLEGVQRGQQLRVRRSGGRGAQGPDGQGLPRGGRLEPGPGEPGRPRLRRRCRRTSWRSPARV